MQNYNGDYDGDYQRVYQVLFKNQKTPGITMNKLTSASGVSRSNITLLLEFMVEDGFDIYTNARANWSGEEINYYRLAL